MNETKRINENLIYQGKRIEYKSLTLELPNKSIIEREYVKHPGAVVIVPRLNDKIFVLIKQYRYSIDKEIFEFPAGTLENGENPIECANREIIEEISYGCKKLTFLGQLFPAPGFCNEIQHCYLAEELFECHAFKDEDELISVEFRDKAKIEEMIKTGELSDSKSIAAFYKTLLMGLA